MSEWQSIDSAPKDGTSFLAYWPQIDHPHLKSDILPNVFVTRFFQWTSEDPGCWEPTVHTPGERAVPRWRDAGIWADPTHWMLLPDPPKP